MIKKIAILVSGIFMAGVFLFLATALLFAFFGWWALSVPLAWIGVAVHYRLRQPPVTLEHRLFAVGLARTNDV